MVLVISLWDDKLTWMRWLDSHGTNTSNLGNNRGPCKRSKGNPDQIRGTHGDASVKYTNFMFGELDSTYTAGSSFKPDAVKTPSVPQPGASQPAGPKPTQPRPALGRVAAFSQCGGKAWT